MDPLHIIRRAADEDNFEVTGHCLEEMDKDGISIDQIAYIMREGVIAKKDLRRNRYTLKLKDIMVSIEVQAQCQPYTVKVITAGKKRR